MRIIAGEARGRKLFSPKDQNKIRPTGDRVKEAIFSMIQPYIVDAVVIDLFAGTGNLGLEALSRGASKAYFVDNHLTSLSIIQNNIQTVKYEACSEVINASYEQALKQRINESAHLIFLDPPYNKGLAIKSMEYICTYDKLSNGGIIVVEHSVDEKMDDELYNLKLIKRKKYGTTVVSMYKKDMED